ncbi:MAG TPA: SCP2 sterol-binding domain-containing protein [Candidatus Udaeobacter sp.]|jgi:putative sterol carrier protein|nr:SCP2 sterol-binding domain-containing protein [Candidatus Udaeobacter sp.]
MRRHLTGKFGLFWPLAVVAVVTCLQAVTVAAAGHQDSTPQDVFDSMRNSFKSAKAQGVHARYQWDLSGPNGGQWWIDVEDGKYKMGKGKIDNPNVTFVASDKDWVAVSNHQMGGTWAYLSGRLKIRGDQGVARKLGEIFP